MAQAAKRLLRRQAEARHTSTKRPSVTSNLSIEQLKLAWANNAAAERMWRADDAALFATSDVSIDGDRDGDGSAAFADDLALHTAGASPAHAEVEKTADGTPSWSGGGMFGWLRGASRNNQLGAADSAQVEAGPTLAPSLEADTVPSTAAPRDAPSTLNDNGGRALDRATSALMRSASYRAAPPGALANAGVVRSEVADSERAS
jgi:hypothetical protein